MAVTKRSERVMPPRTNPLCPNCSRPMDLVRAPEDPRDVHTFECQWCHVVFMTEDHVPIGGAPERRS